MEKEDFKNDAFNRMYKGLKFKSFEDAKMYDSFKNRVVRDANSDGRYSAQYRQVLQELNDIESNEDIVFRFTTYSGQSENRRGGENSFNPQTLEIDIKINLKKGDFSQTQNIAHELKHAYQFVDAKLGYGDTLFDFIYDYMDEFEAFDRQNLFLDHGDEWLTEDKIRVLIKKNYKLDPIDKNRTLSDFLRKPNSALDLKTMKESNEHHLKLGRNANLYIFKGWKDVN